MKNPAYPAALEIINANAERDRKRRARLAKLQAADPVTVTLGAAQAATICRILHNLSMELFDGIIKETEDPAEISPESLAFYITSDEDEIQKYNAIEKAISRAAGIKWPY